MPSSEGIQVQRSWLASSTFSVRVSKEVIWRRHRRIRMVWVVEKHYHDVDVHTIVQQELVAPA